MNMENLEELGLFLQEEIYFLPEDKKQVKLQMEKSLANSIAQEIQEEIESPPIPVKGNFSKGILVIHEETDLSPEVMDMLVKMVNACGHSMTEIGLLESTSLENRSMIEFQALNAHTVIKFGRVKHLINSIPAPPYEVYADQETEYLFADSLSAISEDKSLKKKLWIALQKLFKLTT